MRSTSANNKNVLILILYSLSSNAFDNLTQRQTPKGEKK